MKVMSFILLLAFTVTIKLQAGDHSIDDITMIIWRKQNAMMVNSVNQSKSFSRLMDAVGKETAAYSQEQLAALNPGKFEDRIRLIALARLQHPDLFDKIFKAYVKYPSQQEIEELRLTMLQYLSDKVSADEWKKLKEMTEKANQAHEKPFKRLSSPSEIKPEHFEEKYRFCFEYFWMQPDGEEVYSCYEDTMETALDEFKKKVPGVDMRGLIKERFKTFDPRKNPDFTPFEE